MPCGSPSAPSWQRRGWKSSRHLHCCRFSLRHCHCLADPPCRGNLEQGGHVCRGLARMAASSRRRCCVLQPGTRSWKRGCESRGVWECCVASWRLPPATNTANKTVPRESSYLEQETTILCLPPPLSRFSTFSYVKTNYPRPAQQRVTRIGMVATPIAVLHVHAYSLRMRNNP